MSTRQIITDRFEIGDLEKDLLGRGGMGEVYRATDTQTGELVAVKALNPEIVAHDPGLLERFAREGQALRRLNHPNIVRMVAAVEEEGRHYLVIEYVGGSSLADVLATQGRLPSGRAIEIALDLADALTRAHRLGIIHRDLKPANVLLAQDGTPRLADFGIAHIQDCSHLTQTGVLVGTVDYLSPEICQGEPPNELSDIWAFGVTLFQMLTAKLPFDGKNMTAKITDILTQPVPDLTKLAPNTPDTLVDLIYRMLEKDSHRRIPSVRLVGAELEAIWKGRQVAILHPTPADSRFTSPTSAAQPHHTAIGGVFEPLTDRELEILRLIDEGLSNRDIAQRLVVTLETVKWYNKQIYGKLGVHTRTQAVARAREAGLFDVRSKTPAPPAIAPKHNLPTQVTSFVGREPEMAEISHLLATARLLTLTGPPGTGKTRLALEVAAQTLDRFKDGTFLVDLAPIADPQLLLY